MIDAGMMSEESAISKLQSIPVQGKDIDLYTLIRKFGPEYRFFTAKVDVEYLILIWTGRRVSIRDSGQSAYGLDELLEALKSYKSDSALVQYSFYADGGMCNAYFDDKIFVGYIAKYIGR